MEPLTCIVIDDEQHAIKVLEDYIVETEGVRLLFTETSPLNCIKRLGRYPIPDIAFCDIDMPELSGLDLANVFSDRTLLVYTTAFEEYALVGYEKNALDYMLKPISGERFLACVERCRQRKSGSPNAGSTEPEKDRYFFIIAMGIKGNHVKIRMDDIIYVESSGNYLKFHLIDNEPVEAYLTFPELVEMLNAQTFIRVHRSYLVNTIHIKSFQGGRLFFEQVDIPIPLSDNYRDAFLMALENKIIRSSRLI